MTTWFVTRHAGAKEWAARQGLEVDQVVDHLELEQVEDGDTVLGTLPINLVAELNEMHVRYFHLILLLPPSLRGTEISADMMEQLDAQLEEFAVLRGEVDGKLD